MQQTTSLESFFQDVVDRALRAERVETSSLTEHYLVRLLASYSRQPIDETPLALKLLGAMEAAPRERRERLREVGDTSLFVSGFWSESFARRVVDVDYYIDMGGSAYGQLAKVGPGWSRDPFGDVYGNLAENFVRFVAVLALVSRWLMPAAGPQDIVKLYERWRQTGSGWAAHKLAAAGVLPQKAGTRLQ
jgi:hypothetical protein